MSTSDLVRSLALLTFASGVVALPRDADAQVRSGMRVRLWIAADSLTGQANRQVEGTVMELPSDSIVVRASEGYRLRVPRQRLLALDSLVDGNDLPYLMIGATTGAVAGFVVGVLASVTRERRQGTLFGAQFQFTDTEVDYGRLWTVTAVGTGVGLLAGWIGAQGKGTWASVPLSHVTIEAGRRGVNTGIRLRF